MKEENKVFMIIMLENTTIGIEVTRWYFNNVYEVISEKMGELKSDFFLVKGEDVHGNKFCLRLHKNWIRGIYAEKAEEQMDNVCNSASDVY